MSNCGSVDCSKDRSSAPLPEYADISGTGVLVGYTATAGLTVILITFYYFVAHRPHDDPFHKDGDTSPPRHTYRSHPVDTIVLNSIKRLTAGVWKKPAGQSTNNKRFVVQQALMTSILRMSDLQILTGLSLMISGYTQLRCGLSVYHWQILVYLAWFSCLTHLACLTFLRNYLYNHPGERIWRLVGMSSLVILLIVGLLPTGKASIYGPADYASCSFRNIARVKSDDRYESEDVNFDYATMIVSILFVGFGFLTRFIKLHRSLSIGVIARGRAYLSDRARRSLRRLYKWCLDTQVKTTPTIAKIRVLLIYRPVLAIFLTMRAVLDMWSSYFIEVWWLLASYIWGLTNLIFFLGTAAETSLTGYNWTFGQIVPMILLLAPVLSVLESFLESKHPPPVQSEQAAPSDPPTRVNTMEVVENLASDPTTNTLDNPDRDYYKDEWYQSFVLALAWQVPIATIIILYLGEAIYSPTKQGGNTKINPLRYLVPNIFVTNWLPISFFMSMTQSIGFGIMLDESQAKRKGLIRVFLLLYLFAMAFLFPFFFDVVINLPIFGGMCCVYIIFVGISLRSQKTK